MTSATAQVASVADSSEIVAVDVAYDQFVDHLAKNRDSRTISNSSPAHALSILRSVFRYAEKYVKIFTGSLSPSVYNDTVLLDEMKQFINKREGSVEVLIQCPDSIKQDGENKFLEELLTLGNTGRVTVREVREQNPLMDADSHFIVADDRMYRIEVDTKEITAVSSFNDNQRAIHLRDVFDSCYNAYTEQYQLAAA